MRIFLLIVLAAVALWYAVVGGRRIDESHVYALYDKYWGAFIEGDGKAVCELFDKRFAATVTTKTPAGDVEESAGKEQACEGTDKFYAMKRELERRTGVELFVNSEYAIDRIELSADRKTATVQLHTEIRIGTEQRLYLKMTETQTDTLVRKFGTTRFLATQGAISMF
ncbi:MAG TPA: hypothetical protein VJ652_19660 [Noviherbaspirillum sp.]|nr:hypothetical protein [Noviherbaspirillum sp.]